MKNLKLLREQKKQPSVNSTIFIKKEKLQKNRKILY